MGRIRGRYRGTAASVRYISQSFAAVHQPVFARSVSQNFSAICTIIPTLSSMLRNDRMSIQVPFSCPPYLPTPERLSMFLWSVVPSLFGLWIIGTLSLTNFPIMKYFTALSSFSRRFFASRASQTWSLPLLVCRSEVYPVSHRLIPPTFTDQVRDLLFNMRHVYRHQNSYHNFEHALDVLQAIHMFLRSAGRVPPASILLESDTCTWKPKQSAGKSALVDCLTPADLFCLYVASIGHDVGHPGVTNSFMVSCSFLFLS